MPDKFRVHITKGYWEDAWPTYFGNFFNHCQTIARANGWDPGTVMNHELRPLGGRFVATKTQGWYLRWDSEASHTAFVLRWA